MIAFLKRDVVWSGLILGLISPVLVYGILFLIYSFLDSQGVFSDVGFAEDFRTRTLGLIAICSNLLLMQSFKRHRSNEKIRGVLVASMILVVAWFLKFGIKIIHF